MANQAKSAFLARMSHELRTPLNAVLGYAQILQRDKELNERQGTGLRTIQQSGEHLLALIEDILDLAKIEAGKLELYPMPTPLADFVRGVADMIRIRAQEKELALVVEVPLLKYAVNIDQKRLRQVLLNLLGNAVKFTDRGQVALRIQHLAETEENVRLRLEVQDSGIGIREEHLGALFRPFEQVGEQHRRIGGTGLGLAISRQLVRMMGSDIVVSSEIGRGSTFRFELNFPYAQSGLETVAPRRIAVGYLGPRRKVLVIDDLTENRTVMVDMLRPLGFTVVEAENGCEGVKCAETHRPDIILVDNVMPVMDGLTAIAHIREIDALRDVPIISISAHSSMVEKEKALAAGANAFLSKPLRENELITVMEKYSGVRFVYEDQEHAPVATAIEDAAIAALPPDIRATLEEALIGLDTGTIKSAITAITTLDARLGRTLSRLAEDFNYDRILRSLRGAGDRHGTNGR